MTEHLRKQIINGDFRCRPGVEDPQKLSKMYELFNESAQLEGTRPHISDESLWQLFCFRTPIRNLFLRMSQSLQRFLSRRKKKSPAKVSATPRAKRKSGVVTHATLMLPAEPRSASTPLDFWNSKDSYTQVQIFRHMIRTAKDPQKLSFELEFYQAELRRKESSHHPRGTENPSRPVNEQPEDLGENNLSEKNPVSEKIPVSQENPASEKGPVSLARERSAQMPPPPVSTASGTSSSQMEAMILESVREYGQKEVPDNGDV